MNQEQCKQTAIHEAGHLYMAFALGVRVYRASIVKSIKENSFGFVEVQVQAQPDNADLEFDIAVTFAGQAAQNVFVKPNKGWSERERGKIARLLVHLYYHEPGYTELSEEERFEFIRSEFRRRRGIVNRFVQTPSAQKSILQIADALSQAKRLDKVQVARLKRKVKVHNAYNLRWRLTDLSNERYITSS
jgi:hypothetical protein